MNDLQKQVKTKIFPLSIFAVSMGFFEAIVVVYLRELYYPDGFTFPIKVIPQWLMVVEIVREFSTMLMLLSVAWISGKNFLQRLSVFLFIFGVWDIFYYVALKLFVNWPESLLTWDILFLIPVTWFGPVLAPVICSAIMILMMFIFEYFRLKNNSAKIKWTELGLMIFGAVVIYVTFTYDIGVLILRWDYSDSFFKIVENKNLIYDLTNYEPMDFLWGIFILGLIFIFMGIILFIRRNLISANT